MKLYVVGIGSGNENGLTYEARRTLEGADIIVGYTVYADLVKAFLPDKEYFTSGMKQEKERCQKAVELAAAGANVAVVCSGDSGVYGMASLLHELAADYADLEVRAVAGVTAALSGGALVGAPLGHDFAVISLSDLLTPWEKIEKRLEAAAEADFAICLYNPSSKKRAGYLRTACGIILKYRDTKTVCAAAKNIGRDGEEYSIMTLSELADYKADMFTTVFIGNSQTKKIKGKMVTPRGYKTE
ncbi:MAG: precorrin-3B C(17)-methyltransferase [Clostridia bacterium]|nr:precorrin-3B C(17)-methyltransferase [Clostridia bacterium]